MVHPTRAPNAFWERYTILVLQQSTLFRGFSAARPTAASGPGLDHDGTEEH